MDSARNNRWLAPLAVAIAAMLITVAVTMTFVTGALEGNFRHIFLPAKMFGIPEKVAAHGFDELFQDDTNAGWDGQFYFFIANDPLARADTEHHIDSNAYRYQRIGLPLLAFIVSKLTRQDWVSPTTYYMTNLGLLFLATFLGASFLRNRGLNPCWILLWTLGLGTQVTQLHGLPDGAADALQIIALVCLLNGRTAIYSAAAIFAVLSREIYVLVPAAILFSGFALAAREHGLASQLRPAALARRISRNWFHLLPIAVFLGWQIFIRRRFHIAPSAQATNILDWPFKSSLEYMLAPLKGVRPMELDSVMESVGILLFLAILMTAGWLLAAAIRRQLAQPHHGNDTPAEATKLGISIAFLAMVGMYLCFGSTVMMAMTGYWKAANIFAFLFPFLAALHGSHIGRWSTGLSLTAFMLFGTALIWRINAPPFVTVNIAYASTEPACLAKFDAQVQPLSLEVQPGNWRQRLTGSARLTIHLKVTNTSDATFAPYVGKGAVNASYQWLNAADGSVAKDGIRTSLRAPLPSGASTELPLSVELPSQSGRYILALSLVQEGCAWFYQRNPQSKYDIPYTVR